MPQLNVLFLGRNYSSGRNLNISYSPTDHSYTYRGSPITPNQSPMLLPPKDLPTVDDITDVDTLNAYLKDFDRTEKLNSSYNLDMSTNLLSSFWSHPVTKSAKDSSSFLRRSFYQLSTRSQSKDSNQLFLVFNSITTADTSSSSPNSKTDDKGSPSQVKVQGMEMWLKLGADITRLTLWKENLRLV